MMRKVYITGLRPEYREQYIKDHENVPRELLEKYKAAGMKSVAVYLLGDTLVLITEQEGDRDVRAALANDPVCQAWEERMRPMKSEGDYQEMKEIFRADL
jgi:L-rhamnose mutarotase